MKRDLEIIRQGKDDDTACSLKEHIEEFQDHNI